MGLLKAHSVNYLVDIRTMPRSRHNPQFNEDALKEELKDNKIGYLHMKGLGGLRHPGKDSVNLGWQTLHFTGLQTTCRQGNLPPHLVN